MQLQNISVNAHDQFNKKKFHLPCTATEPKEETNARLEPSSPGVDQLTHVRDPSLVNHTNVSVVGQHTIPSLPTEGVQLDLGLHDTAPHEVTRKLMIVDRLVLLPPPPPPGTNSCCLYP